MKKEKTGRFPVYQVADNLKRILQEQGFRFVDDGDGDEVEKYETTYAMWEEPEEAFGWAKDPIKLRQGHTILRTRILPAYLNHKFWDTKEVEIPKRLAGYGRVYRNNEEHQIYHQIEGAFLEPLFLEEWFTFLKKIVGEFLEHQEACEIRIEGETSYQILLKTEGKERCVGWTGLLAEKVFQKCKMEMQTGYFFLLDIEQIAMEHFEIETIEDLYDNNVERLKRHANDSDAVGDSFICKAVDILRELGYQETCGEVLYSKDVYKKMNMIQESWDKNNSGYPLCEKLGDLNALRTVLTPATEEILAYNYKLGNQDVRTFEVSHIYLPRDGKILPKEHIAITMGAYGDGVNIDTFREDVSEFLKRFGLENTYYVGSGMATAYKWNECYVIMDEEDDYLGSNCGQISRKAQKNYGIGTTAFMANFELTALVESLCGTKKSKKEKMKAEMDRD